MMHGHPAVYKRRGKGASESGLVRGTGARISRLYWRIIMGNARVQLSGSPEFVNIHVKLLKILPLHNVKKET